jgi:hypothetical protein
MSISAWRILLLALIGVALVVSAILSTRATMTDASRSVSAHAVLH